MNTIRSCRINAFESCRVSDCSKVPNDLFSRSVPHHPSKNSQA
jgi:hypothetical protein